MEFRGGLEAAIQTFPNAIGPLLLFAAVLGPAGAMPGLWATLITAMAAPVAALMLGSDRSIISSPRTASLVTFTALVLQLSRAATGPDLSDAEAFRLGLLATSLLFLFASTLVLVAGLLRWGLLFKMIPSPVFAGIGIGTALLLVWQAFLQSGGVWQHAAVAVGMLLTFLAWPMWRRRPSWLFALGPSVAAPLLGLGLVGWLLPWPSAQPVAALATQAFSIPLAEADMLLRADLPRLLLIGLPGALTLALVMVLETFSTAGMLELRYGVKVDAHRELVALGGANMFSALLGGVPSTGTGIGSSANWEAGGRGKMAVVACMLLTAGSLMVLCPWLSAVPAGLVAGFLLMHAVIMTDRRWLGQAMHKIRQPRQVRLDQAFWLTTAIALVACAGGLTWATFLGIGLSTLIVLRRLAHRSTARWESLRHHRSRRIRSAAEQHLLDENRDAVAVLRLNGHLFFGNSVRLRQLADEAHPQAKSAVIDVSSVQDVDTSGSEAVQGLVSELGRQGMTVVLCGLQSCRAHELQRGLEALPRRPGLAQEPDLDRALERCENMVLQSGGAPPSPESTPLERNRLLQGLSPEQASAVLAHGRVREVDQAQALFQREEPADDVWLIERGSVSVLTQHQPGSPRLATFGPGHFIGEMAFLDGRPRSATALADTPVRALQLDAQAFAHLRSTHPEAALELALNIARELSTRVRAANLQLHAGQED
ncbi:MAG: cyclic nucleotide-binding domain-containing protein [Rubrivivax sp.]|jgi:SulP family sulfate permease|nr:cyclic nucleotide-binding domain-containing protein [Rubrivivax sp.]